MGFKPVGFEYGGRAGAFGRRGCDAVVGYSGVVRAPFYELVTLVLQRPADKGMVKESS